MSSSSFRFNPNWDGPIRRAAERAIADASEHLLEEANRTAPIEEGTLIRSGKTTVDKGRLAAAVSYDTPYAVRQHEDTRLRHDDGRRAKWLQRTLQERSTAMLGFIGDTIRRAL